MRYTIKTEDKEVEVELDTTLPPKEMWNRQLAPALYALSEDKRPWKDWWW